MADTQQGVRQQSARDAAGTTDTHSGDLRALFESVATVPAGSAYNEAFMLWLQSVTGSSADNINDLAALYASQQDDTYNWSSVGPLGLPVLFGWNPQQALPIPANGTFVGQGLRAVDTTTDGISFWQQNLIANETPFVRLRRIRQQATNSSFQGTIGVGNAPTAWQITATGDGQVELVSGSSFGGNSVRVSGNNADAWISMNTAITFDTGFFVIAIFIESIETLPDGNLWGRTVSGVAVSPTADNLVVGWNQFIMDLSGAGSAQNFRLGLAPTAGSATGDFTFSSVMMYQVEDASAVFDDYTDVDTIYNAGVPGIQIFATTNENTVNGVGNVTLIGGNPITGGGASFASTDKITSTDTWPAEHHTIADLTFPASSAGAPVIVATTEVATYRWYMNADDRTQVRGSDIQCTVVGIDSYLSERHKMAFSMEVGAQENVDDEGQEATTDTGVVIWTGSIVVGNRNDNSAPFDGIIHEINVNTGFKTAAELSILVQPP